MKSKLNISFSGKDYRKLFQEVLVLFKNRPPNTIRFDYENFELFSIENALNKYKTELFIKWDNYGSIRIIRDKVLLLNLIQFDTSVEKTLKLLEYLSFEIASFGSLYEEWFYPDTFYAAPSFGNGHIPHGWACAFKGDGYKRLVSRRWLDFGPWKQFFGGNNIQLVQFHQLGVSSEIALSQCMTAHQLMGISSEGGFIQDNYVYKYYNRGIYDFNQKIIKIIVHGGEITERQLLDACAAKYYGVLSSQMPVNNVAYVFMDENKARERLHSIWLHNLECRTIKNGKEIVLNNSYFPSPKKPDWVLIDD